MKLNRGISARPYAEALAAYGWQLCERGWALRAATSASLCIISEQTEWLHIVLTSEALPNVEASELLFRNYLLTGPAKWVAGGDGAPECRIDVPLDLGSRWGGRYLAPNDPPACDPWHAWAQAVRALALAETLPAQGNSQPEAMLDELQQQGWAGSVDQGRLKLHVSLPGLFRQICIESSAAGLKAVAELADLSDYPAAGRRAAWALAYQVNRRLPLVRMALDKSSTQRLSAEVWLGVLPISSTWLATALEVVEAALSLAAREIQALRDPELATLVLAAASDRNALG